MTQAQTPNRGRHLRQLLLAPAVAAAIMMAAAPAGASPLTVRTGTQHSARALVVKKHAHAPRHPSLRFYTFGRKVG